MVGAMLYGEDFHEVCFPLHQDVQNQFKKPERLFPSGQHDATLVRLHLQPLLLFAIKKTMDTG